MREISDCVLVSVSGIRLFSANWWCKVSYHRQQQSHAMRHARVHPDQNDQVVNQQLWEFGSWEALNENVLVGTVKRCVKWQCYEWIKRTITANLCLFINIWRRDKDESGRMNKRPNLLVSFNAVVLISQIHKCLYHHSSWNLPLLEISTFAIHFTPNALKRNTSLFEGRQMQQSLG